MFLIERFIKAIYLCENKSSGFNAITSLYFVFQVMAASVRCDEIAKEKLKQLTSDEALKLNITFFPSFLI